MTIGATTTFSETADEICSDALSKLGVVAPGTDASAARTTKQNLHARRALNRLVKSMDSEGEFLWRTIRRTANLTIGDASFAPATDVLDIDEPMRYSAGDPSSGGGGFLPATILTAMSRDEYMAIPDRTITGRPTRYYVEGTVGPTKIVYLYPACDTALSTMEYAAFVRGADFTSGADTPDYLQKWARCLVWGLAAELAPDYGQTSKLDSFNTMFMAEKERLLGDDNEKSNLRLVPFGMGGGW